MPVTKTIHTVLTFPDLISMVTICFGHVPVLALPVSMRQDANCSPLPFLDP